MPNKLKKMEYLDSNNQHLKMTPPITFSVLITVFNKSKYLEDAIQSVLNQTYTNFELIIIDDNSTDNSPEILERYASTDKRIRIYKNTSNKGDYPNRNYAISKARFEYLKFLDADDVMMPNALGIYARNVNAFKTENPGYYFTVTHPSDDPKVKSTYFDSKELYRREYITRERTFSCAPNSCLYKKSVLRDIGLFREEQYTSDFELAHRISQKFGAVVITTSLPLSIWREHPNQQSQAIRTDLTIGGRYLRISYDYLIHNQDFFTTSEFRAIINRLEKAEAQAIRSSLKRLDFMTLAKVLKKRISPLPILACRAFTAYKA